MARQTNHRSVLPWSTLVLWLAGACTGGVGGPLGPGPQDTGTAPIVDTATTPPELAEQRFVIEAVPELDIVFVVDNSCSMERHQTIDLPAIERFTSALHGTSWRVGVTTANVVDDKGGRGGQLLMRDGIIGVDATMPNAGEELAQQLRFLPTQTGSGWFEAGFAAAYLAAEDLRDVDNAGFFRDGAALHIVVISDEDDDSDELDDPRIDSWSFHEWMEGRSWAHPVSFHAITCLNDTEPCSIVDRGYAYQTMAEHRGWGEAYDLVDEDVGDSLETIGLGMMQRSVRRAFVLSPAPPWHVDVVVEADGDPLDPDLWTFDHDADAVRIDPSVAEGTEIRVTYPL